jgi:hypothetical protein
MVEFDEQQKIIESTSQRRALAIAKVDAIIDRKMERPTLAEIEAKQVASRKVHKTKCNLEMALLHVKQAEEVTTICSEPRSSEDVMESCLKAMADAERVMELYRLSRVEAKKELEEINAPLAAAKAEEKKLTSDLNHLLSSSERKSHLIKHLKENSYHDQVLRPSWVVDEIREVDDIEHTFHKSPCALCKMEFPHFDIILAPCMC